MNFGGFNRAREQVSNFFSSNEIFHFSYKDVFHCLQLHVDRRLDFPLSLYWVFKKFETVVWEINTSEVATAKSIWSYCFEKIIEAHSNWLWRRKVQKWTLQSFTKLMKRGIMFKKVRAQHPNVNNKDEFELLFCAYHTFATFYPSTRLSSPVVSSSRVLFLKLVYCKLAQHDGFRQYSKGMCLSQYRTM